jgi:hypothetical protein
MENKEKEAVDGLLCLVLLLPSMLLFAYAGKTLWWWFLVPLGLPAISMAHAFGIDMLVSLWTMRLPRQGDNEGVAKRVAKRMLGVALMLAMGWGCHKLMLR